MYIFWFSERVKLNSCVVGIEEFDDHVKVRCVDGKEYKVCHCPYWFALPKICLCVFISQATVLNSTRLTSSKSAYSST